MSGVKSDVQKLLQDAIGKQIPYVHCFNHQLHLVVAHAMEIEPKAKNFLALCQQLYVFFKRQFAAADPGGVRWVRTNPPPLRPGVVVENAITTWLYQSSSVRDIFTEIVSQLYTT